MAPWYRTSAGVLAALVAVGCAARPDPAAHAIETCELVAEGAAGDGDRRTGAPLRELLQERFAELAERDRAAYLAAVADCEDDLAAALDAPARGRADEWTMELGDCLTDPDGFALAGVVGNPTDDVRSYRIVVEYELDDRALGREVAEVGDVAPGQDASWEIDGELSAPPDPEGRCRIVEVAVSD